MVETETHEERSYWNSVHITAKICQKRNSTKLCVKVPKIVINCGSLSGLTQLHCIVMRKKPYG